jgi:type II secretory pathway component PulF
MDNSINSSNLSILKSIGKIGIYYYSISFLFIAVLFIIIGVFIIYYTKKNKMIKTEGVIDSSIYLSERNYDVKITYNIDNVSYTNIINSSNSKIPGNKITIYYNINNPNEISEHSSTTLIKISSFMILFGIILFIFIIGSIFYFKKNNKKSEVNKL